MSLFEFDDQQGVRTRGTLRAPGATPGDVLTVGPTHGTVTPSPGGGSQPVSIVTVAYTDVLADQLGDGSAAAPLLTVPARSLLTVVYAVTTVAFDDSGLSDGSLQVVDGADSESLGDLSAVDVTSAPAPNPSGFYNATSAYTVGYYAPAPVPIWLLFPGFQFDGAQGSIGVILKVETGA